MASQRFAHEPLPSPLSQQAVPVQPSHVTALRILPFPRLTPWAKVFRPSGPDRCDYLRGIRDWRIPDCRRKRPLAAHIANDAIFTPPASFHDPTKPKSTKAAVRTANRHWSSHHLRPLIVASKPRTSPDKQAPSITMAISGETTSTSVAMTHTSPVIAVPTVPATFSLLIIESSTRASHDSSSRFGGPGHSRRQAFSGSRTR
jgi:hypothetical protein